MVQSITALAHLRAAVLYVMDISEQCGYTIAQQAELFHSIKPLFSNKPLMVVANKTDAAPLESLSEADTITLKEMVSAAATASNGGMWSLLALQLCYHQFACIQCRHSTRVLQDWLGSLSCMGSLSRMCRLQHAPVQSGVHFVQRRFASNICSIVRRNHLAARGWCACTACTVTMLAACKACLPELEPS